MTGFSREGLPFFLFVAGGFHFVQVIATCVFAKPLKSSVPSSADSVERGAFSEPVRRGLIGFVIGTGVLVMVNARAIVQGGQLATSLCLLLALIFSYRWYVQLFQFSKFLCRGASRLAHWVLVVSIGFICIVYSYAALVLFVQ